MISFASSRSQRFAALVALFLAFLPADSQSSTNIFHDLKLLRSPNRAVRLEGLTQLTQHLPKPPKQYTAVLDLEFQDSISQLDTATAEAVRTTLLQALKEEQTQRRQASSATAKPVVALATTDDDENKDSYYETLLFDVASLGDRQALPLLVKELKTGGIVGRGVARFGALAVPSVIAEGNSPHADELNRDACPQELALFLTMGTVPATDRKTIAMIEAAALRWANSAEFGMREGDAYLLATLNDRESIAALQQMALKDPQNATGENGVIHYGGRETASGLLQRLGSRVGQGIQVK